MQVITLKEFLAAVLFSVIFAWIFIYAMPSVMAKVGYDEAKMQDAARANAYHQYLIRKGVINE